MPKKENSNFPKPNASFLPKSFLIPNWCETCMHVWKSTTEHSITLHQHKTIFGRKMLKLIKQIGIT